VIFLYPDIMAYSIDRKNAGLTSPLLTFDSNILRPAGSSQFIIPEGQAEHRSKMETAFSKIGGSIIIGGLLGGTSGLFRGMKDSSVSDSSKVKRTMVINQIAKQGSHASQIAGSLALIFSLCDTILTKARGFDDSFNTIAAATVTGATYSVKNGLKNIPKNGMAGFALSAIYVAITNKDMMLSQLPSNKYF